MSPNRQTLHDLVNIIEPSEIDIVYRILIKFIPEDVATPDETKAMNKGLEEIARGEVLRHEDIDWN